MKMILDEQRKRLLANGEKAARGEDTMDTVPVVKFFNPVGAATWLISEMDPQNNDILYGIGDLGMGSPEFGTVSLSELESLTLMGGLKIERDRHFDPKGKTMKEYGEEAWKAGVLVA